VNEALLNDRKPELPPEARRVILYALDARERPKLGVRVREWTAVESTDECVLRQMARCLREIAAGHVPK
jgi:hypothetical protein